MLIKDIWLSNYFPGGGAYHYQPEKGWCNNMPSGFMYAKVKTEDYINLNHLLHFGFNIIETTLLFEQKSLSSNLIERENLIIRETRKSDRNQVIELSSSAFKFARFYQDPNISEHVPSKIKKDWVDNFYLGSRGTDLFVCEKEKDLIAGFILLNNNTIDLIATDSNQLGKGIASGLISYANQKIGPLKAGTQSTNTSSVNLYLKNNFFISETKFTLHKHS